MHPRKKSTWGGGASESEHHSNPYASLQTQGGRAHLLYPAPALPLTHPRSWLCSSQVGERVPVQQSPASKKGELLAERDQSSDNHRLHLSVQDHRLPHNDIHLVVTGARMVAVVCWG